ncbi:hypothetical protein OROGR_004718 [Orobanche gracilis]
MDKFNFVRDGRSKLPPGFRFQPTDEEIVFQYLARKIFSCPLPARVIPEIDNIFSYNPLEYLPGGSNEEMYFFSNRERSNDRNVISNRSSIATCGGHWRPIGFHKQISCSKGMMPIIGIRRTLVFCKGKTTFSASATNLFMHLYCIAVPRNTSCIIRQKNRSSQFLFVRIGKWDLCRIFLKKVSIKAEVYDNNLVTVEESDADSCSE